MDSEKPQHSIAMVVLNSISHDTRVLKEAHALAEHGCQVTIVGIQDGNCAEPETSFPLGVRAIRVGRGLEEDINIGAAIARQLSFWAIGAAVLLLAAVLYVGLFLSLPEMISRVVSLEIVALRVLSLVAGGLALVVTLLALRRHNRLGMIHANFAKIKVSLVRRLRHGRLRNQIAERVSEIGPDVVHCHDVTGLRIGEACIFHGFAGKLVYDSHELYEDLPHASIWHRLATRKVQDRMAPKLSGFITINDSIARVLKKRHPAFPDPVIVKNAARRPSSPVQDDGRLHDAAGLDHGTKILLYQGGFSPNRGLTSLVRSAAFLPEGWAIVLMGWGREESLLRKSAAIADPDGQHVRFVPRVPQPELALWTAGATVGVIPYARHGLNHWFCTPNKLWEYPSAGVPILASPFPEMRRVIEGHDIGVLLSDPIKPENIAWTLRDLSSDRLEQLRQNCATFIELDNWALYEDRLKDLYGSLLCE